MILAAQTTGFNVGVKVEDPEDGHEETQLDHDGQELTSTERHDCTIARWHTTRYLVCQEVFF